MQAWAVTQVQWCTRAVVPMRLWAVMRARTRVVV